MEQALTTALTSLLTVFGPLCASILFLHLRRKRESVNLVQQQGGADVGREPARAK